MHPNRYEISEYAFKFQIFYALQLAIILANEFRKNEENKKRF